MAFIEILIDSESPSVFGGEQYSSLTAGVISHPGSELIYVQATGMTSNRSEHANWSIPQLCSCKLIKLRCVRTIAKTPSEPYMIESIVTEPNSPKFINQDLSDSSKTDIPNRKGAHKCEISIGNSMKLNFVFSGIFTFQVTLQYHDSYVEPILQIGCSGDEDSHKGGTWFESKVSFDEYVFLEFSELQGQVSQLAK
jgi:hypothetical protein